MQAASLVSAAASVSAAVAERRPGWGLRALGVLALTALLFFARLGGQALLSREFRWAEVAREMRLNSSYFWPTLNGDPYYYKPLLGFWFVAGAAGLTGTLDETAVRLPAATAGVLGVAFLVLLVRRLYGAREAVFSGFILATSFSYVYYSRHGPPDIETVTGVLAALWLFVRNEGRPDGWWVVWLWLVMAATALTKSLAGFVLPLLVIGVYSCLAEGWAELGRRLLHGSLAARLQWLISQNRWFFNWKSPIAVSAGAALYLAPYVMSTLRTGSTLGFSQVYTENFIRYFHPYDHRATILLYAYSIFGMLAPWSALLPAAFAEIHHARHEQTGPARADRFVLVYFWATFLFFTFCGARRVYYILPIVPAGATLVARALARDFEELWPVTRGLLRIGYFFIAISVAGAIFAVVPPSWALPGRLGMLPPLPDRLVFVAFWVAAALSVMYALRKLATARIFASAGVCAYLLMTYVFVFAMPASNAYRGEKPFAAAVRRTIGTEDNKLAVYLTNGPIFYLGLPHPVPYYKSRTALGQAVKAGTIRWVIIKRRDIGTLDFPAKVVAGEPLFPFEEKRAELAKEVLLRVEPAHS